MRRSFEWDEEKAKKNYRKHRVSFEEGITVFNDPFSITIDDPDHSEKEQRYLDIGASEKARILVISYIERRGSIRVISCRKATRRNGATMKRASAKATRNPDGIRAEYDFTGGTRGKHYRAMQAGYTITIHQSDGSTITKEVKPKEGAVVLAPDVQEYFPDAESVNAALRSLIKLIPEKCNAVAGRARGNQASKRLTSRGRSRSTSTRA